jgi:hypothetical protein
VVAADGARERPVDASIGCRRLRRLQAGRTLFGAHNDVHRVEQEAVRYDAGLAGPRNL